MSYRNTIHNGVWVTMVTPFKDDMTIDYEAVQAIVEWHVNRNTTGIFAVCQSSEMFMLDRSERKKLAAFVVKAAAGRIPVVVSGHVSDSFEDQLRDVDDAASSGADGVILVSNRFAGEDDNDDTVKKSLERFLSNIDSSLILGIYECPYPYKRLLSPELLKYLACTGRFGFFKDTCCDNEQIKRKIAVIKGSKLQIFNANAATLLQSLIDGVCGYSGVMANFHPELYLWLCDNYLKQPELAHEISDFLSVASTMECRAYPSCAKYFLSRYIEGINCTSRTIPVSNLTDAYRLEVDAMERLAEKYRDKYVNKSCI